MKCYLMFGASSFSQFDTVKEAQHLLTNQEGKIDLEPWEYQIFKSFPTSQEIETYIKLYDSHDETPDTSKLYYRVFGYGSIRIFTLPQDTTIEQFMEELNIGEQIFSEFPTEEEFENVCKIYDDYQTELALERQVKYNKVLLSNRSFSGQRDVYSIAMTDEVSVGDTSFTKLNNDYEGSYPANAHVPMENLFDTISV